MASPPACRTSPVMLSSPGALLQPSFYIEASNFAGRMTAGASSIDDLLDCCGSIVFVCSLLDLYSSW